jgi:hypothetical protein
VLRAELWSHLSPLRNPEQGTGPVIEMFYHLFGFSMGDAAGAAGGVPGAVSGLTGNEEDYEPDE